MTKNEVQDLLSLRRDLDESEQIQAFDVIIKDLVSRSDPCEFFFAGFSVENFLSGYVTTGFCSDDSCSAVLLDFLDSIPNRLCCCSENQDFSKKGQVLYYICRFLVAKNQTDIVMDLCNDFLSKYDGKGLDTITHGYLKHFSKKNKFTCTPTDLRKSLQADVYIRHSQTEARKQISRYFLDDPYESALHEYPSAIRGTFARLYYMQSLAEKQNNNSPENISPY